MPSTQIECAVCDAERWPFAKRAVSGGVSWLCGRGWMASEQKDTLGPAHCSLSAKAGHEHIAGSVYGVVSLSRIRSSEYNGPAMGVHTHSTRR